MLLAGCLFTVLSLSATCNAENPGIKLRMTQHVLEEGVQYLFDKMSADISTYNLPNVNGSTTIDEDEITYKLTNIKIAEFDFKKISSSFVPGTGVKIFLDHGNALINSQCDLDSWIVKDSGPAVLTLNGTSILLILGVRRVEPGFPSVFMLDCQTSIKNIDFTMMSGISYVYDALKPHMAGILRSSITEQLCSALRNQVLRWDMNFRNLNLNITLFNKVKADLSLTSIPEVYDKYADLNLKGQFHVPYLSPSMNHSPAPFTLPAKGSSRSCAGISEVSLNSLVDAYYSSGSLNSMLSTVSESMNLTTSELAKSVPEISKHFTKPTPAKITLYATSSPKVNLKADNITMDFEGLVQVNAYPEEGKSECVLDAKILAVLDSDISMSEAKGSQGLNISGSLSLLRIQIDKTKPSSIEPKIATSDEAIQHIFDQILLQYINDILKQGMVILSTFLKNPSHATKQAYELVEMDISWD